MKKMIIAIILFSPLSMVAMFRNKLMSPLRKIGISRLINQPQLRRLSDRKMIVKKSQSESSQLNSMQPNKENCSCHKYMPFVVGWMIGSTLGHIVASSR